MIKFFDRNSTKITISEFYDNFTSKKYNFEAPYQRKGNVWTEDKKSFLIDSILKNYPMPHIFMMPEVNTKTGKTQYDVVDGKQRLQAIIEFIEDKIPLTNYFFEDAIFINNKSSSIERKISGKLFSDIKKEPESNDFVKQFWTYTINVDYLYETDLNLISTIFDRLNRNGEPLTRQELRNAKYHSSYFLSVIKELVKVKYWEDRFIRLKDERMEDEEFISELLFVVANKELLDSNPEVIDNLYDDYSNKEKKFIDDIVNQFNLITKFIEDLHIDYISLKKLNWTTHLYGLFSVAWFCINNKIQADGIKDKLISLYNNYFNKNDYNGSSPLIKYKSSCSSNTRSLNQRKQRLNAILEYCDIKKQL